MRLAVIGTLHRRWDRWPAMLQRVMVESTRPPDEMYVMTEDWEDFEHLPQLVVDGIAARVRVLPTPRSEDRYAEIPYSRKINWALDRTRADYIAYLTDDSLPHPDKYRRMVQALNEHPEWGAVYCSQDYGRLRMAVEPISDAYCVVDHTQVMHRRTEDRWPLDVSLMRIGDATFWRSLHRSLGAFYPVPDVLDTVRQTSDGISATW